MTMDLKILSTRLGPAIEDSSVSSEWESIMKIFSLSSEDLLYKWESFVIYTGDNDMQITVDNLTLFQQHLQRELEEKSKRPQNNAPSSVSKPTPSRHNGSPDILGSILTPGSGGTSITRKRKALIPMQTPSRVKTSRNIHRSSSPVATNQLSSPTSDNGLGMLQTPDRSISQPILSVAAVGGIVETLNGHIEKIPFPADRSGSSVELSVNINLKKFNYRTMYQKLGDASEVLDLQIEDAVSWVKDAYKVDDDEFGNPAFITQADIITVGRIVSDSNSDGRLNMKSMMIESSRRLCSGMRIRLSFDSVSDNTTSYSFFPGQIVAFRGSNANGEYFAVKSVIELPLLPIAATSRGEMREHLERQGHGPLQIFVASGPYTTQDNLTFDPLRRFVDYINTQSNRPDAIILHGPFLDFNHPLVQSGDISIPESYPKTPDTFTLDDIFKALIKPILTSIDSSIQIILIPSIKDIISNHAAFPQKPLDRKSLELPKNFRCLSNPATFQLNEVVFTTSTTDSVYDIVRNLITDDNNLNNITAAMEHIVRQRRVYPVFPGSMGREGQSISSTAGTSIDVPYLGLGSINGGNPDIIITPSILKHTAQIVNSVVTINPGQLTKGKNGTFGCITVNPLSIDQKGSEDEDEDEVIPHKVWERTRVDIINI